MSATEKDRRSTAWLAVPFVLGAALILLCGGCLFLGIFLSQKELTERRNAEKQFVATGTAAVIEHFGGEVRIVQASLARPTESGFFVAGQYQRPQDRVRDFLATVDRVGDGCQVSQLIVDGEVVIPKP